MLKFYNCRWIRLYFFFRAHWCSFYLSLSLPPFPISAVWLNSSCVYFIRPKCCLIHLCLCSKYEHFLNIYASHDSITQIYVVFQCSFVTWFDGSHTNTYRFCIYRSDKTIKCFFIYVNMLNRVCLCVCMFAVLEVRLAASVSD